MKKIAILWPWLAAICSGLLCTACFPPFNQTWFCWIALTPLIAAILFSGKESRHPWLRNFALGYVTGLTFFWTVLSWLQLSRSSAGSFSNFTWRFTSRFGHAFAVCCDHEKPVGN